MYGYNNLQDPYGGQQNTFQPPTPSNQIVFDYKKAREAGVDDTKIFRYLSEQKAKGVNIVVDKNDIASYHDNPVQEDKPNYNVFKPASPDASFGEKAVRGVGNFITNVAGKFGGFLENKLSKPLFDNAIGAASAIPTTINPNLANKDGMVENKFTGNQVKPWFSGDAATGKPQTFTQGAGEILQRGAELAPWFMIPGEGELLGAASNAAKGFLPKVIQAAKGAIPLATGMGVSGALAETGSQMQSGEANIPAVLGRGVTDFAMGFAADAGLRGASSLFGKSSKVLTNPEISKNVADAVDKALKPSFSGVKTPAMRSAYYKNADTVFETIHNLKPEFKDINGEVIKGRNPQTLYEMAQSFPNAKQTIFNEYDNIAAKSGQQGAQFNPQPIIDKLKAFSEDVSHSPEIRAYAAKKAESLAELQGASPKVIQSRIAELNKGLDGLQLGTELPRLEVDASIAEQLRANLDQLIEQTTGESYAPLKKLYGSFSAIENDLNRAVNNYLRKSGSGLPGITDIFTGGDITAGILTANPALIAKGVAGKGIKEYITWFTNPNRYIKKAFQSFEGVPERIIRIKPTEPITNPSQLLESPKSIRLKPKTDNSRLLSQAEAQAKLDGYKKKGEIKLLKAPLGDKTNPIILKSPKKVPLIKNNAKTATVSKLANKSVSENPLFAEARKYKSADEFVKAVKPRIDSSRVGNVNLLQWIKANDKVAGTGATKDAFLSYIQKEKASGVKGLTTTVQSKDGSRFFQGLVDDGYLKPTGIDAAKLGYQYEYTPKVNTFKSQLTDIYNQATKADVKTSIGNKVIPPKAKQIEKQLQELSDSKEFQDFSKGGKISGKSWNEYQRLSREYRSIIDNQATKKNILIKKNKK